jgi:hypothetical protein
MPSSWSTRPFGLTSYQLSFSTADIERNLFYTPSYSPVQSNNLVEKTTIMVVGGEEYNLDENNAPAESIPLTAESGIFHLVPAN